MDFGTLLYTAHKNEKTANKDTKCYKTKFEPPKKEIKSRSSLSANIQKYLQKRDEDERRKADDEKRKKEELLALRSQDRKAFKRVQTMLKRTKSANKSVIEDAVDNVNTAVTLGGPQQCDEDDYGYVSQEASAYYAKLMDKYSNMPPEEPKFPQSKKPVVKDLNAAKDRVRAALQKEEEEEMMPHKRKRKSKADKLAEENGSDNDERQEKYREASPVDEPKPKKVKKMAPPPLDFSSLLKLAEQKQFEPVKIEKKVSEDEDGRPMTKKQRIEFERERERRERRMEEEKAKKSGQRQPDSGNRIPKISDNGERKEKLNGLGRIPKKSTGPSNDNIAKLRNLLEEEKSRNSVDSDSNSSKSNNQRQSDRSSLKPEGDRLTNKSDRVSYKNNHVSEKSQQQSNHLSDKTNHVSEKHYKSNHSSDKDTRVSEKNRYQSNHSSDKINHISEKNHYQSNHSSDKNNRVSEKNHYQSNHSSDKINHVSEKNHYQSNHSSDKNNRVSEKNHYQSNHSSDKNNRVSEKNHYQSNHSSDKNNRVSEKNQHQSNHSSDKNNRVSEKNHYPNHNSSGNLRKFESSQKNYDRKPSQASIASNKIKSRMHNVSDEEHSEASDVEKERSSVPDRHYKTDKYSSKQSSQVSLKKSHCEKYSGSDGDRSPTPDNSKYKPKYSISQSDSGSEDGTKYKPRSINSPTVKKPKIKSLFEGSDDDDDHSRTSANHDSSKSETKRPKPYDTEKYVVKSKDDPKFRNQVLSKPSLKSDNDRVKSSSSTAKPGLVKDKSKTNDLRSDSYQSSPKSNPDRNRSAPERPKERSLPSKDIVKKESSKKTGQENAEEILKKDASVWSKPCNLPAKHPSGLSESQIQRLREMNKKPTPSRTGELNKQIPRDVRSSDGRPQPRPGGPLQGRPNLMKAAAAAAAARTASQKPASNESSKDRDSLSRPDKGSSSRSNEKQSPSKYSTPSSKSKELANKDSKPRQLPPKDLKPKQFPPSDLKPRQFPPSDLKPRQFPPSDLKPRQFPPKDVRPRQFPPPDVRKKPNPRRIIEDDSEDEYDSEMDDFIDDGSDCDQQRISEEIQSIFGYDKNRYIMDDDEDDECMESNFGQIDQEELRSLKIGAAEDLKELLKEIKRKKKKK